MNNIKDDILRLVKQYYKSLPPKQYNNGETYINYGGRIYNEDELCNLVSASLEFWLTSGHYAEEFSRLFAKYIGVKHCSLVNSGSSANLLAISSLKSDMLGDKKLKDGDEVITLACGFPTTLNPILQNNLVPVFVDIELPYYNVNINELRIAYGPKVKAVFLAHTLGNPFNISDVLEFCNDHSLYLIEDNCDAVGSKYKERMTGSFGTISTASFYPAHLITMGQGGAVLTNDSVLYTIIESLKAWGRDCICKTGQDNRCGHRFDQQKGDLPFGYDHKYIYSNIGYNLDITDLQASIGVAQMGKIDDFVSKRKKNFKYLKNGISDLKCLIIPESLSDSDACWFGFPITLLSNYRNEMVRYLEDNKIATRLLFGGNLLKQPAYKGITCRVVGNLKITDTVLGNTFWVGVYPGITNEMLDYMVDKIRGFVYENITC